MSKEQRLALFLQAIANGQVKLWEDPGHAWLQVPKAVVAGLKISSYSYQDATSVYLEEDCDVARLANELEPSFLDWKTIPQQYEQSSRVRNLPAYRAQAVVLAASERM